MKIFRRILLVILLTIPAVKFAQSQGERDAEHEHGSLRAWEEANDVYDHIEKEDAYELDSDKYSTQNQVNKAGSGRVYVYYGTGHHRPYKNRRYYYHRKGYPYGPYYYRYYYYPYQRPIRFYRRGG